MIAAAIGTTPESTEGQDFCASGTPICTRLETVKTKPLKEAKVKVEKVKSEKSGSDKSDKSGSDGRRNLDSSDSSSGSSSGSDSDSDSCKSNCVIFDCGDAGLEQPACFDVCAAQDFNL